MTLFRASRLTITPGRAASPAIRDLDLAIDPGCAVALVGPSGCGKSTLARALVGLEPRMAGSLRFGGVELVGARAQRWKPVRRVVSLCWQDSAAALDPRLTIGQAIAEARALAGRLPLCRGELDALLGRFHLSPRARERRPAQLSGGQRQRAALARAIAGEPQLLVADEVTSAVDRAIAVEIVRDLAALPAAGTALLFVTHDLSLLPGLVDEVLVVDRGRVVERASPACILEQPVHELTRALADAVPRLRRWGQ